MNEITHDCPACGERMILDTRTLRASLDGMSHEVPDVHGWFCDACGEIEFTDNDSAQRYAEAMDALVLARRARLAAEIRRMRKRIRLTQKEAGEIFGGGVNAFSRYERGETDPPKATFKLLRLLSAHPEHLDEVRA